MCEQCLVNPLYFGEVLPGWFLIRARRDGIDMKCGQWGLLRCNNPDFIWTSAPQPDPTREMTKEEEAAFFKANPEATIWEPEDFDEAFFSHPMCGYELISAAMQKGYDPKRHGYRFTGWLWGYLGDWIRDHEPTVDEDPFPVRDTIEGIKHDYTLGKT